MSLAMASSSVSSTPPLIVGSFYVLNLHQLKMQMAKVAFFHEFNSENRDVFAADADFIYKNKFKLHVSRHVFDFLK